MQRAVVVVRERTQGNMTVKRSRKRQERNVGQQVAPPPERHSPPTEQNGKRVVAARQKFRAGWWIAFGILAVLCALPWFNVDAPLRYDEAYTLVEYVSKPDVAVTRDYSLPNNHIANSLLLRIWWNLIGRPDAAVVAIWVMRVPLLLIWGIGVVCFFLFVRIVVRPDPLFAALLTGVYAMLPQAVEYAFQLRGYGPSIAWYSILLACFAAVLCGGGRWLLVPGAMAMFMANYTVPTNLFVSAALSLGIVGYSWFGTRRRGESNDPASTGLKPKRALRLVITGVLTVAMVLSVAAYLPVREQMKQHAHTYTSVGEAVWAFPGNLWRNITNLVEATGYTGFPWLTALLAVTGLIYAGSRARGNERARLLCWLVLPLPLVALPVQSLLGRPAFMRNYCVALPLMVALFGWAAVGVGNSLNSFFRLKTQGERSGNMAFVPLAFCLLLALAVGGRYWHKLNAEHRPVALLRYLRPRLGISSLAVYDREADSYALFFYGVRLNMGDAATYYEYLPKELVPFLDELYVAVGERSNLGVILRHFGLEKLENTDAVRELATFGNVTVYRVRRLQYEILPVSPVPYGASGLQ